MPYPSPDHPRYCPMSRAPVPDPDERDLLWQRCPGCGRLIAPMANGRFFPHLDHPTRLGDRPRETLTRLGIGRRSSLRGG